MAKKSVLVPKELYDRVFLGLTEKEDLTIDNSKEWINAFTSRQRPSAMLFFDHFKRNGISVNDKGELIKNDKILDGSHVVDLIKDSLHHTKKEPVKLDDFLQLMKETHLPRSYIKDLSRTDREIKSVYNQEDTKSNLELISDWINL